MSLALQDYVHPRPVPIGVSNRHLHLSGDHVRTLYGPGATLTHLRGVTQKGQYACHETVTLVTAGGVIHGVRVIGPERKATQVELSATDARVLRIRPPVRDSGNLEATVGCTLVGPAGTVVLEEGVILPVRHLHMCPRDAEHYGVADMDRVRMLVPGDRGVCFNEVLVRVHETFVLDFHLDTDEANAVQAASGDSAFLVDERRLGVDLDTRFAQPARGRRLLTEGELRGMVAGGERVRIPAGVLLTPSARDLARRLKMV